METEYMSALTFDTLRYAKKLKESNFTEEQADVLIDIFKYFQEYQENYIRKELATKMDLQELELKLNAKIEKVALSTKNDILRWLIGLIVGLGAFLVAVLPYTIH